MSQHVLICAQHGGFGLSHRAFLRLRELGSEVALAEPDFGEPWSDAPEPVRDSWLNSFCSDIERDDPLLLQVYREMGDDAAAPPCRLALVELPDGVKWHVEEYDGLEWVAEDHRTWYGP